jgi:hypothetical protein
MEAGELEGSSCSSGPRLGGAEHCWRCSGGGGGEGGGDGSGSLIGFGRAYQWGVMGITACRCMDGGEMAVLCRRGGRVAAAGQQHKRDGGRNKRGAVEDWWPVIDMTSRLFVHNNLVSLPFPAERI